MHSLKFLAIKTNRNVKQNPLRISEQESEEIKKLKGFKRKSKKYENFETQAV
jgi:hypothetical protein